jgi:hypothetical protein
VEAGYDMADNDDDWMAGAIDEIARSASAAHAAIDAVVAAAETLREKRRAGASDAEIFDFAVASEGRQTRLRASAALDKFERSMMVLRARLVRSKVDQHKVSFSRLAPQMEVSRQMVARLYRAGVRAAGKRPRS